MSASDPFHVPWLTHLLGGCVSNFRGMFLALGRLESAALADELAAVALTEPVYVCGLARAGTTLLHHALAAQPGVATHRARDYPLIDTPCWSRKATAGKPLPPTERAHGDRVRVNSDSPEALEEMLWMAFFPGCHDPRTSGVLGASDSNPAFETFYRDHVRKLLLAEKATRYVAKANYHVGRLAYLSKLFPDAKFVLAVREPVAHIGSLMRQHWNFSDGERRHPRALAHMRRAGHFEFGLDRRPMNLGERVREVESAWASGDEVRGWAIYWAMVHDHLADVLASSESVRAASVVVPYERMCDAPAEAMAGVLRHCDLPINAEWLGAFAAGVRRPDYYENPLSPAEAELVRKETAAVARRWGYG